MVARVTRGWQQVGPWRLHVRHAAGDAGATPVVCVHGWGVSGRYMEPTLAALGGARGVWAPDLPGHGRSARPRRALAVEQLADLLVAWMDATGIERAAFVGNSMGCQTIVDLALRHRARVNRLVLVGPALDDDARSLWRHFGRLLADIPFERASLTGVVAWDYLRMGPQLLWQEFRHMWAEPELAKMRRVDVPALVVRGAHDAVVPMSWARRVAEALRAPEPVVVPRWGHALNYSAATELCSVVERFVGSEWGRSRTGVGPESTPS